jgi:hypothetical protein
MSRDRMKLIGMALAACLVAIAAGASAREFAPQSNQELGVTVRAKPVDIGESAKSWTFEIALDTHSQDLADDFRRSAVLIDANGKPHAPLAWDGAGPGGHHRAGVLRFEPITPLPAVLELRIQRPGEPAPRSFRWSLK